jgi:predicted DNA-binding protein (MmcQ/YjbR family)
MTVVDFERARSFCNRLPAATQDIMWGADLCFSVGGRMSPVTVCKGGKAHGFSFKVDANRCLELTDRPGIRPAPEIARAKRVSVDGADALTNAQARELLARPHAPVAAKLTRKLRAALGLPS